MTYVKSHPVSAQRIIKIAPLLNKNGALMSPELGLVLHLENGEQHQWLAEKNGGTVQVGDYFVRDEVLGVDFILSAERVPDLIVTD